MKLLLDTHALLWWLADDQRLSARARALIANENNQVFVSAVSGWEIGIKRALGRLEVNTDRLLDEMRRTGFELLHVHFRHGLVAGDLPPHHRDPFDRMLIAQARCEGMTLVSKDGAFSGYGVDVIW